MSLFVIRLFYPPDEDETDFKVAPSWELETFIYFSRQLESLDLPGTPFQMHN